MRILLVLGSVLLFAAVALPLGGCSDKYDDTELRNDVNGLKDRIAALENQLKQVNSEIGLLQKAVDERFSIAKVEKTAAGYKIIFTDNSSVEITNGKNGADAPVVGVKKDADGIYYWTLTTGGMTEWIVVDGAKLRVTGETGQTVTPTLSVDSEGYWTISYDGGKTWSKILDGEGHPISALGQGSSVASLFRSVTEDDNNVYFELSNGSIITVAKRGTFYMLIRKAPETASFVYGETQTYEVEAVGVEKVVVNKPDEWKVSYAESVLTITAPTADHAACAEAKGVVSIIYFCTNGQSDAVTMGVVVEKDYTGATEGDNYAVNITEITDKTVTASITPVDANVSYYVVAYDKAKYDKNGEAAFVTEQLGMFNFYLQNGMDYYLDMMLHKGAFSYSGTQLKPESELYIAVFGVAVDKTDKKCTAATPVMTVPFKTKRAVVINSQYRISVSDVSWYGATYTSTPTDDLGYLHGFVKKSEFAKFASDAEFMADVNKKYRDFYYKPLYEERVITWNMVTTSETKSRTAPDFDYNQALFDAGVEDMDARMMPLIEDTEYYVYSFASADAVASSPLSKAVFKTGEFSASESCTFTVTTSVERQDVTVSIVPSNKSCSYIFSLTEARYYQDFENDLQFAVDDLFWTKYNANESNKQLSDYIVKGNYAHTYRDCMAATAYIVCVYGATADGVITTEPVTQRVLTKGTIDQTPSQAPKRVR